jgi:hypothetical protein
MWAAFVPKGGLAPHLSQKGNNKTFSIFLEEKQ